MKNKDEQIFTDYERKTLRKSLDKISDEMGINSYDVNKQNQILLGRLEQLSYLYRNKSNSAQVKSFIGIFAGGRALVAPGIAMALTFTLGIVSSQLYNSRLENQRTSQSVDTLRSNGVGEDKILVLAVNSQNQALQRAKYLEAALKAELKIEFNQNDATSSMQVFGLEATNPKQLEFKAITGLSPTQAGSVIFTFTK